MISLHALKIIFTIATMFRLINLGVVIQKDEFLKIVVELIGTALQLWIALSIYNL